MKCRTRPLQAEIQVNNDGAWVTPEGSSEVHWLSLDLFTALFEAVDRDPDEAVRPLVPTAGYPRIWPDPGPLD